MGFSIPNYDKSFAILNRDDVEILWASDDDGWKNRSKELVDNPSGAESFLAGTASCRIEVQEIDELYNEY